MAKKKTEETLELELPEDHSYDKKYRPLLIKHLLLATKWASFSREASAGYPGQLTREQAELYKQAVQLQDECREAYEIVIQANLYPQPLHFLSPIPLELTETELKVK